MKRNGKRFIFLFAVLLLLLLTMAVSMRLGSFHLSWCEIWTGLTGNAEGVNWQVLFNIRMPRILLGALVGGCFAVSGAVLQSVMRNPLASPDIIGVSSGGGLAGVVVMLAFPAFGFLLLPAAFAGAMMTVLLVYLLAWKQGVSPVRLILAGVAVSVMLGAFTSAVLLFHAERAGGVLDFTIGSLAGKSWPELAAAGGYMAAGFAGALLIAGKLNILALGDEVAKGLGLRVELVRFAGLGIAALLAAAGVCVAGMLGFVGLIAPHMMRILLGGDNRFLLPASAFFGGFMVVACDTAGRLMLEPGELPAGILMAMLGPPFFLYLLRSRRYEI